MTLPPTLPPWQVIDEEARQIKAADTRVGSLVDILCGHESLKSPEHVAAEILRQLDEVSVLRVLVPPILHTRNYLKCTACGYRANAHEFAQPTEDSDLGYACPMCGMDESGLVGPAVASGPRDIDLSDSSAHNDRMSKRLINDDEVIFEQCVGMTKAQAKQELVTDPDLIEVAEKMAENVRVAIFGDDDELMDSVDELAADHFAGMIEDDWSQAREIEFHDAATDLTIEALQEVLKPLVYRILATGDWREK